MKTRFFFLPLLIVGFISFLSNFGVLPVSGQVDTASGAWSCNEGLPEVSLEWNSEERARNYKIIRNSSNIATVKEPETNYLDRGVTYDTFYHYVITPNHQPAEQVIDINTGSCIYVKSLTGPTTNTVGTAISYSTEFVAGFHPGNASYALNLYNPSGTLIWNTGGTKSLSGTMPGTNFSSPGTYKVCAEGSISQAPPLPRSGSVTSASKCQSVVVSSAVDLWLNGSKSNLTLNKGQTAVATWECKGASECFSSVPTGQNVEKWSGRLPQASANLSPGLTLTFNDATTNGGVHKLRLEFNPSDERQVTVNEPPQAVLDVKSVGASSVVMTRISGYSDLAGTTDYRRTATSAISGTIQAPLTASGNTFSSWSGCDSVSDRNCTVSVGTGSSKTVSASYSAPIPLPDLHINGEISFFPASPQVGDSVTISGIVRNSGQAAAGGTSVSRLKIDLDSNGGGTLWDYTHSNTTSNLNAGISEAAAWDNVWTAVAGTHSIRICTDDTGVITEADEANNCRTTSLIVGATPTVLNVHSSGVSGVRITRTLGPTDAGGTTNYSRTYSGDFGAAILAPASSGGGTFESWSDCTFVVGRNCAVLISAGNSKTVTANYTLPAGSFNYSLANSGTTRAVRGAVDTYTQNTITKTMTAGSRSQQVTLTASGLPTGVSYTVSNQPCSPTCVSVITFTVSPSATLGTHSITVTGSPLGRTTVFDLEITGSPLSVSCVPSPEVALLGELVTWTANVSGGVSPYTYSWRGSGIPTNPAPTENPYSLSYSTIGQKFATVEVTDFLSNTASCPASSSAQVNFNPQFEEF